MEYPSSLVSPCFVAPRSLQSLLSDSSIIQFLIYSKTGYSTRHYIQVEISSSLLEVVADS